MERKLVGIRNEMIKNVRYDKIIKFIPKNWYLVDEMIEFFGLLEINWKMLFTSSG
jgi:hypothetical protein